MRGSMGYCCYLPGRKGVPGRGRGCWALGVAGGYGFIEWGMIRRSVFFPFMLPTIRCIRGRRKRNSRKATLFVYNAKVAPEAAYFYMNYKFGARLYLAGQGVSEAGEGLVDRVCLDVAYVARSGDEGFAVFVELYLNAFLYVG